MIDLSRVKHIYLMPGPTDLRRGSIGLISLLPQAGLEVREHELFLFCNRAGTILKVVERDETGTWLYTRTVDRSKFGWPQDFSQAEEINRDQIVWLLQGLRAIGFKCGKEVCFY